MAGNLDLFGLKKKNTSVSDIFSDKRKCAGNTHVQRRIIYQLINLILTNTPTTPPPPPPQAVDLTGSCAWSANHSFK